MPTPAPPKRGPGRSEAKKVKFVERIIKKNKQIGSLEILKIFWGGQRDSQKSHFVAQTLCFTVFPLLGPDRNAKICISSADL